MSELVPERLLSRASSIDFFGSIGLTRSAIVLAGVVATVVAPTTVLAVGGAPAPCLWFAPLTWRRVRASGVRAGSAGETASPPRVSGCPDSNWGPLRPERSALPGCATPRIGS